MTIYNYDKDTKEFLNSSTANASPLEIGVFLIPSNATDIEPPIENLNEKAVFDEATKTWGIVPDFRNESYWLKSDKSKVEFKLGDTVDTTTMTDVPPIDGLNEFDAVNNVWVKSVIQTKNESLARVKQGFLTDSATEVAVSVTDLVTGTTNTFSFKGGYESAQLLDGKRQLIKESFALGLVATDNVDFRDSSGIKVQVSMADATTIVLSIANAYEAKFSKYKDLKLQIEAIDITTATVSDYDAIIW